MLTYCCPGCGFQSCWLAVGGLLPARAQCPLEVGECASSSVCVCAGAYTRVAEHPTVLLNTVQCYLDVRVACVRWAGVGWGGLGGVEVECLVYVCDNLLTVRLLR
jgi:hypothetical protein